MATTFAQPHPGITTHWWVPLVRGLLSLVFGIVVLAFPLSAVVTFVILFGAFALVDGIFAIVQSLRSAHPISARWWAHLAAGLAGILIGVLTFAWPGITAFTLGAFIAAWALITGILEVIAGFGIRNDTRGEVLLIVAGAVSVVLGIVLFFYPLAALVAWIWIVGVYAIVAGLALIALAIRLRSRKKPATA